MASHDPIAYTYEADVHCPVCARERFGAALDNPDTVDNEGNTIGVIASWDETSPEGEYCGDCWGEIAEPWENQPEEKDIKLGVELHCDQPGTDRRCGVAWRKEHAMKDWSWVRYKNKRYQVFGGFRGPCYIDLDHPIPRQPH